MKKKDIYLIRHGQTALNAKKKALGQSDVGLTDKGIEEVVRLAQYLSDLGVRPARIYTSPLERTTRTAQLLQNHLGGVIETHEALREINYGVYEGEGRQVLREIKYGYDTQKMQLGKGETGEEVEKRVILFLRTVLQREEDQVFIVAHAFILSVLAQIIISIPRTFSNIQPLSTADYSYFRVEKGGENTVKVLSIQRNCLKGALSI